MKHEHLVHSGALPILEKIKLQYAQLKQSSSFELQKLFAPDNFSFDAFCKDFGCHPRGEELKMIVEAYGRKHDIWLPNAQHHVTCALYLYPDGDFERMLAIMKNLVLGFYLNDVMGRDLFQHLPNEEQHASRKVIQNMASLTEDLIIPFGAHNLELLNAETLLDFKHHSPASWFAEFLKFYSHHLDITHADRNSDNLGHVPTLTGYTENRCHYAGVHHVVLWIQYNDGRFLDWDLLKRLNLYDRIKRLHWLTAAFGCLSNDLFSFEKEVIDQDSDSNLVMIVALNDPELSLEEAIMHSCFIVRNIVTEFIMLLKSTSYQIDQLKAEQPGLAETLHIHLKGIKRCVQATWLWHCHSKRYKRPGSLWLETKC